LIREALETHRSRPLDHTTVQRLVGAQAAHGLALGGLILVLVGLHFANPRVEPLLGGVWTAGIHVSPGDTTLERGSSLVVMARFPGGAPAEATLVVQADHEPAQRVALVRSLDDPMLGVSVPDLQQDLRYRIEWLGEQTRDFRVTLFDLPKLERADARLTYPAYTGLPEKTIADTRRVSAVEGTTLEFALTLNKPVPRAEVWSGTNVVAELRAAGTRSNLYPWSLVLAQSQRYDLVLEDEAGRTNKFPAQFFVDVLTNRIPELKLAFPRGDQRVSPLEELTVQGEVVDDFGVRAYGLTYALAGQEPRTILLGEAAPALEKRAFSRVVAFEDLAAQPDQLLSYYLWAEDIGPDGQPRRTVTDLFFAEVRPFEEIFRENQSASASSSASSSSSAERSPGAQLAELQKQIISATWKVHRLDSGTNLSASAQADVAVIRDSQRQALEQTLELADQAEGARRVALLDAVQTEMAQALEHLEASAAGGQRRPLEPALAAEQTAYQALLKLNDRERQVAQGRSRSRSSRGGDQRMERQLDQLDLRQSEDRYETESQASARQPGEQREDVQVSSRLRELAQRQQDLNDRLQDLQTALQEARTDQEREELRRQLKRLREEEQNWLADLDELRQRMNRPENQSRLAEARQRLEQTRAEAQRAAESMDQGDVGQALASGTRAERGARELRDELRRQSASQFEEDLRQLRRDARSLAQRQEDLGQQLDELAEGRRRSLSDSGEPQQLAEDLERQAQGVEDIISRATRVTELAENVEPLLSRQLYDTLRQAAQDEPRSLQRTTEDLLREGRLRRSVYETLEEGRRQGRRAVQVASELLRSGATAEASQLEDRARENITNLRRGVERAAESVLGDDTEGLRAASRELAQLEQQLEDEIARAEARDDTAARGATAGEQPRPLGRQAPPESSQPGAAAESANRPAGGQGSGTAGERPPPMPGPAAPNDLAQARNDAPGTRGGDRQPDGERSGARGGAEGPRLGGLFEQGGSPDGRGGWRGPLLGPDYGPWTDRMREVEEMIEAPDLRTEAARIRERVRAVRLDYRRHGTEPQWDLVRLEVAQPLGELRSRVEEELARRAAPESLVPIDRDPVPPRFSEFVRRYYERLGKSD